jgi:N-acetylmuramoyl-L-alanine amidase
MAASLLRAPRRASLLPIFAFSLALLTFLPVPAWSASGKSTTVVLDAGHGGFDRGGIPRQVVAEKTMTLDVAQRVRKILGAAGYRVIMTRDSDVFVTLGERVRIANGYGNAIFVCIHFNSAARAGANGIETYYYSSQSAALAANIHRQVVAGTTSENRGIRRRGYYVLRHTSVPAVLVECGFLTNPTEARLVLQSSYRERLADRIADGIMGKPASNLRPVAAGLVREPPPIRQPFNYNDFVRAEPERSRSSGSSRKSTKIKSTTKKSSSSSKKKSASSSTKKKSSTSATKKKKKTAEPDE